MRTGGINLGILPADSVHNAASDTLSLYFAAGDLVIGMVTTSLRDVLDHVLAVRAGRSRDRAARAAHLP